ncbi:hypothetical protein Patl1_19636 [Pistacia atlantica]|uniref:Uncharacterized protein n=1 Tax=Pistacia atlantica TaxID=434234 RepID=A0ACC1BYA8_9ROSI|nr:hypothetical protein Patl1_19636 [Pistacia atlantica]
MVGLVGFGCVMCVCRSSGRSVGWACGYEELWLLLVVEIWLGEEFAAVCRLISLDEKKKQLPKKFLRRTNELGKMVPRTPQTQHCKWSADNGEAIVRRSWNECMDGGGSLGHWNESLRLVFTKNEVVKRLKVVFGDEKGKKMTENMEALKEITTLNGLSNYTMRFWMNYIDYNNGLKRHPRDLAKWFKNFLK